MSIKRKKNRVSSNNKNIKFWYFLIDVTDKEFGHVGYFICKQAYVGKMTTREEDRLTSLVSAQCELNGAKAGLTFEVVASGSLSFCENLADRNWWLWTV